MKPVEKISSIIEGFKFTRIEDPIVEKFARERAKKCGNCDHAIKGRIFGFNKEDRIKEIEGLKCDICQCGLSEKLRSKRESCPKKYWNEHSGI